MKNKRLNLFVMSDNTSKVVKIVLECIKLVITALLGYFGGNAVM